MPFYGYFLLDPNPSVNKAVICVSTLLCTIFYAVHLNFRPSLNNWSFRITKLVLQAQIARLRKEGAKLIQQENEYLKEQLCKKFSMATTTVPWDSSKYRIKIKWKAEKTDENNGGYTSEAIQRFLSKVI